MSGIEQYKPTERFSNRARQYAHARPGYPADALEFICSHCDLTPGKYAADIGAGTGISSRALASKGLKVVAVEPNVAMLDEAMDHEEYRHSIEFVKANAEDTGLPSDTFDAVVSAQAFHWFNPDKALKEFHRLLKSNGWAVLIWNERDESDEFTKAYGDLLRTLPDTSVVEVKRGEAGQPLMATGLFANAHCDSFANSQSMNLDKLIGRAMSASYAPDPDSPEALDFENKLTDIFNRFQIDGSVLLKYKCSVYTAQKQD